MGVVRTYESRRFEIEEFRRMIAGDLRSKSFAGDPVPPSSSKSPRKTTSITGDDGVWRWWCWRWLLCERRRR
ncbi:hypothetical protein HanPSC8_Chr04g0144761 [Helianthus annuus]|nr:hypothetical protein HanPSC8_Chr04g0144761 [Helianthus annuus]